MDEMDAAGWETAVLSGGPADGVRLRLSGRPSVLQVNHPCQAENAPDGMQIAALHIYRRDLKVKSEPLRYGFDGVSP